MIYFSWNLEEQRDNYIRYQVHVVSDASPKANLGPLSF